MPFTEINGLKYFTFEGLNREGIRHGIFTRRGGVSPAPWASLNTGGLSGDERKNVIENRRRIFAAMDLPVESIFDVWQVHSSSVIYSQHPRPLDTPHQKADAIFTDHHGVSLFMRFGDCVPILLYDPIQKVIAIAHAGWQGTVKLITEKVVTEMCRQKGCHPEDIFAGIGPSIGADHYPVGADVVTEVTRAFGDAAGLLIHENGKPHFDLWQANATALMRAGVRQIEIAGLCTACHNDDWYSHRFEHGKTGRFGALISLV